MPGVNGAERVLDVLELLVEHPQGIALSQVARELSLAKSVTHRLLATLMQRHFVEQPPGRDEYRLGLRLSSMGFRYISQSGMLDVCQPIMNRLAAETGELVRMALADTRGLTWAAKAQGSRTGLRYDPDMGSPLRLHVTSSGRAWLATLPVERAHELVLANGFAVPDRFGQQRVTSLEELDAELERTRRRGYGLTVEEIERGTAAIAIAIPAPPGGESPGTVSVLGPVIRMSSAAIEEMLPKLAAVVAELGEFLPLFRSVSNDGPSA